MPGEPEYMPPNLPGNQRVYTQSTGNRIRVTSTGRRARRTEGGMIMRRRVAIGAAALAIGVGALAFAQDTQPIPGFGSGILKVSGTVDIGNTPLVLAHQAGEWKVVVANAPDVRVASLPAVSVAPPEFVRKGSRYEIT